MARKNARTTTRNPQCCFIGFPLPRYSHYRSPRGAPENRLYLLDNGKMKIRGPHAVLIGLVLSLAGCSDAPKTAEPPKEAAKPKPAEPLTGRQAFQRMYPQARAWAADAQPFQLKSIDLADVKPQHGKAGAWQVIFVSA